MHRVIRSFLAAAVVLSLNILSLGVGAQPVDAVSPAGAANLRATSAFTPRGTPKCGGARAATLHRLI